MSLAQTQHSTDHKSHSTAEALTVIEGDAPLTLINWRELWRYRDLLYSLVWRDIKTRYAQSVLGVGWAVIQPVFSMIVFTIVFGNFAKVSSDGVPYAIFNFTALVPWTYFSNALSTSSSSLVTSECSRNRTWKRRWSGGRRMPRCRGCWAAWRRGSLSLYRQHLNSMSTFSGSHQGEVRSGIVKVK